MNNKYANNLSCFVRGFTLIELAMVMMIIGLLLGGLIPTISSQIELKRTSETRQQLEEIQQALLGFAIVNGRLPCPAIAGSNGEENPIGGGNCSNFYNGFVPAATLGLSTRNEQGLALDAWSNPIHYAVTQVNSNAYTTSNKMATTGISSLSPNLLVCNTGVGIDASSCATGSALTADPGVPVVLYSLGKNGGSGGTSTDEAANPNPNSADNNRTFVSHTPTDSSSANGEFDDIVIWISNPHLLNRMVSAGKLP
ncbi:MAG: prepilin-type N-terminal cleavage/methylation domain-containing protein [Gammaproteobacteria bacterium]|nr:prepilin-type N-terminal cleavage/methylation domain-containing protein [Gammaproteobacteria bacterium]MBU1446833.1 prepilin-type N-terminal cleavage/methylation domain-containing protein [Gammaproteobacteria bacterium]